MAARRSICLLLLTACLLGGWPGAFAQHQGVFVGNPSNPLYQKLPEYENELYGHAYANQAVSQRINRLEKTLFGASQPGALETRFARIEQSMAAKSWAEITSEQEPMLAYLEQKLFQRTFEGKPLPDRLDQLEIQVFGKSFDDYPLSVRLKKLTYAMPIMAKGIRLSNGDGMVIASTNRMSPRTGRTQSPEPEITMLDASAMSARTLPNGMPVSTGDYFQSIHKLGTDKSLRWLHLPVRLYVRPGTPAETAMTQRAIRSWSKAFSVETASSSAQADIVIDWNQKPGYPVTRPMLHMNEQNDIRTAIFINMGAFKGLSEDEQLHAMLHQLGHAFGLWGHSDDPNDVMYPHLTQEANDIPAKWAQRSAYVLGRLRPGGQMMPSDEPSQRDINTLLRIYDQPGYDLSVLNSY